MIIHVTAQDIEAAGHKARDNPITRAMQRETQQQWIVFDGHTAHELSLPYRSVKLPEPVATHWQQYRETGSMQAFEFEFASLPSGTRPTPLSPLNRPTPASPPPHANGGTPPTNAVRRQERRDRRREERRLGERRRHERRRDAERRHIERVSAANEG